MIDLYTAGTANGHRAAIALEESGLAYRAHKLNLQAGDQRKPEYLKINPAAAIPAIVDDEGPGGRPLALAQSGAIVLYVAEKSGKFIPKDPARRLAALQWLMQACSDVAGTSGTIFQLSMVAPEKSAANVEFFEKRLVNALRVADQRLADREYLADEFSIADLALYPVAATRRPVIEKHGGLPNLARWAEGMIARPGVAKGMQVSV
ncbi:MAG TPA: glutathione S-transferase N-terminal domain-containing protein [Burkholderiales bacterium]|nr:glutathione S-transferase N-terminal domain-containing protein [Burkholderiales bacterium]